MQLILKTPKAIILNGCGILMSAFIVYLTTNVSFVLQYLASPHLISVCYLIGIELFLFANFIRYKVISDFYLNQVIYRISYLATVSSFILLAQPFHNSVFFIMLSCFSLRILPMPTNALLKSQKHRVIIESSLLLLTLYSTFYHLFLFAPVTKIWNGIWYLSGYFLIRIQSDNFYYNFLYSKPLEIAVFREVFMLLLISPLIFL